MLHEHGVRWGPNRHTSLLWPSQPQATAFPLETTTLFSEHRPDCPHPHRAPTLTGESGAGGSQPDGGGGVHAVPCGHVPTGGVHTPAGGRARPGGGAHCRRLPMGAGDGRCGAGDLAAGETRVVLSESSLCPYTRPCRLAASRPTRVPFAVQMGSITEPRDSPNEPHTASPPGGFQSAFTRGSAIEPSH